MNFGNAPVLIKKMNSFCCFINDINIYIHRNTNSIDEQDCFSERLCIQPVVSGHCA